MKKRIPQCILIIEIVAICILHAIKIGQNNNNAPYQAHQTHPSKGAGKVNNTYFDFYSVPGKGTVRAF